MTRSSGRLRGLILVVLGLACGGDASGPVFVSSGPCDGGLALSSTNPDDAAKTIGICDGLVSADWVYPNGVADTGAPNFAIGHGLLIDFGPNNVPREGNAFLVLSTGSARAPDDSGYSIVDVTKGYSTPPPAGFPQAEAGCPALSTFGFDGIALEVVLQVPAGVRSLAFDYQYFTNDYPQWICTNYVDQAVALVSGVSGMPPLANVLLDASGNPILASATTIRVCDPDDPQGTGYACSLGDAGLSGTGYDAKGASGWLSTASLPVVASDTVRIRVGLWDTGDAANGSTLLVDNFRWIR
jgi:hypothetical protein